MHLGQGFMAPLSVGKKQYIFFSLFGVSSGWCSQSGHRGRERTETRGVPVSLLCCSRGFCRLSLGRGRALVPLVPEHRELSTAGFPWPLELGWCRASLPGSQQGLLRSWAARPPALQVLYFGAVLASVVPAFVWLRAVCIGVSSRGDASLLSRPGAPHQAACRSPDKLRALRRWGCCGSPAVGAGMAICFSQMT